jgi:hypothetical protein
MRRGEEILTLRAEQCYLIPVQPCCFTPSRFKVLGPAYRHQAVRGFEYGFFDYGFFNYSAHHWVPLDWGFSILLFDPGCPDEAILRNRCYALDVPVLRICKPSLTPMEFAGESHASRLIPAAAAKLRRGKERLVR